MPRETKTERTRLHTSTLLTDLERRLLDVIYEDGREDLADAVHLLCELARADSAALRSERSRIISILNDDDDLVECAEKMKELHVSINQAIAERQLIDGALQ
ncbi:hypothetical protein Nham_2474 [Nitrobacter hamburgensis X14]|uniref:Uncharacterized protein n=1 Tax=Nitrobacter hamburgensis (strain DSM 10229 / NCIMB 13809 / X14) TaxID=323097 RepID=Q1QKI3_NITHX|nr:hypothetical protein [Nitrobacter hamburgensis]ABE63264.1 hypothetical protein Nham_2474 [Nitrobacter hamburgensis X14]